MPEDHHALALPLGVKHVGEVGASSSQDAPVCPEPLSMYHEDHITVDTLLQEPGDSEGGAVTVC